MKPDHPVPVIDLELGNFIATTIIKKVLCSIQGEMELRRARWIICSRTSLKKNEANRILIMLMKVGLIEATPPQSNNARMIWLTRRGTTFLKNNGGNVS